MTLFVDSSGSVMFAIPPKSLMGVNSSLICGQEVRGLVTIEAERWLREFIFPQWRKRNVTGLIER